MSTTLSSLPYVRRTAVGVSATAQGADGTIDLARTAAAALADSAWAANSAAPSIPVHEYDRECPSGDAWKGVYGYSAEQRSQRSACGAVVYTFTLPSASGQTVDAIAATVTGDRYLADGVNLHAVLSSSAEPPTVATLLARTPDAVVCATGAQTAKPNDRVGVIANVELANLGSSASYLHIALLLHNYECVRGAWIEGGAMLDPDAVAVTFSGDVSAPSRPSASLNPIMLSNGSSGQLNRIWHVQGVPVTLAGASGLAATAASGRAPLAAQQIGLDSSNYDRTGFSVIALSGSSSGPFARLDSSSNVAEAAGSCSFFDAAPLRAGMRLALPAYSGARNQIRLRAILVEMQSAAELPPWTRAELWAGSAPECIGAVEFDGQTGATLYVKRRPEAMFVALILLPISTAYTTGDTAYYDIADGPLSLS